MKTHSVLGATSVAAFLKKYWQKKPLLIPQAFADMRAPLSREALFEMAAREDVESRLLTNFNDRWSLKHGPFTELPSPKKKHWTLLVQGLNLHLDQAAELLHQFRFIPDARVGDEAELMQQLGCLIQMQIQALHQQGPMLFFR